MAAFVWLRRRCLPHLLLLCLFSGSAYSLRLGVGYFYISSNVRRLTIVLWLRCRFKRLQDQFRILAR
jgi:hypothetical protein